MTKKVEFSAGTPPGQISLKSTFPPGPPVPPPKVVGPEYVDTGIQYDIKNIETGS